MFERMVGLVKNSLYKVVGLAKLNYKEMQEVLLDIQMALNNRPLTYFEDNVLLPVLTPNLWESRIICWNCSMMKLKTITQERERNI